MIAQDHSNAELWGSLARLSKRNEQLYLENERLEAELARRGRVSAETQRNQTTELARLNRGMTALKRKLNERESERRALVEALRLMSRELAKVRQCYNSAKKERAVVTIPAGPGAVWKTEAIVEDKGKGQYQINLPNHLNGRSAIEDLDLCFFDAPPLNK